jgi:mono/diheme cytochrome c family protein
MSSITRLLAVTALGLVALGTAAWPAFSAKFDAKAYYGSNCAVCHAAAGEGGMGPNLKKVEAKGDKFIATRITKGSPAKGMPPFAKLGAADLKALTAYVKSL